MGMIEGYFVRGWFGDAIGSRVASYLLSPSFVYRAGPHWCGICTDTVDERGGRTLSRKVRGRILVIHADDDELDYSLWQNGKLLEKSGTGGNHLQVLDFCERPERRRVCAEFFNGRDEGASFPAMSEEFLINLRSAAWLGEDIDTFVAGQFVEAGPDVHAFLESVGIESVFAWQSFREEVEGVGFTDWFAI
jgi:hypothetical protein